MEKARGRAGTRTEWFEDAGIDIKAVAILNRIIQATDAEVVISSSWRIATSLEAITKLLNKKGFVGNVIGSTPILGLRRGLEIQAWIDARVPSPDSTWAILDDDSDMEHLQHLLVKTTFQKGLQVKHVRPTIKLLNGK